MGKGCIKAIAACAGVAFSVLSYSADIYVTSSSVGSPVAMAISRDDVFVAGDGVCTIREALFASRDGDPVVEVACRHGSGGRDNVIIPPGTYAVTGSPLSVSGRVNIEGSLDANANGVIDDDEFIPQTILEGVTNGSFDGTAANSFAAGYDASVGAVGELGKDLSTEIENICNFASGGENQLMNVSGSLRLKNVILRCGSAGSSGGGAVHIQGGAFATFDNVWLEFNKAPIGGAVALVGDNAGLTMDKVRLHYNLATLTNASQGGGAIYSTGGTDAHFITVNASSFIGNTDQGVAGALDLFAGNSISITNSTFIENMTGGGTSSTGAGAISFRDGGVRTLGEISGVVLNHLTVVDNRTLDANHAGGLYVSGAAHASLSNSIVAGNEFDADAGSGPVSVDSDCSVVGGVSFSSKYNVYGDSGCTPASTVGDEDTNSGGNPSLDALIDLGSVVPPSPPNPAGLPALHTSTLFDANGKFPPLYRSLSGATLLIDTGNPSGGSGVGVCGSSDQRNASRLSGSGCDIGAFEFVTLKAIDDAGGSNRFRGDRRIVVDVLGNDVDDTDIQLDIDDVGLKADDNTDTVILDTTLAPFSTNKCSGGETPAADYCYSATIMTRQQMVDGGFSFALTQAEQDEEAAAIAKIAALLVITPGDPDLDVNDGKIHSDRPFLVIDSGGRLTDGTAFTVRYKMKTKDYTGASSPQDTVQTSANQATVTFLLENIPPVAFNDRVYNERGQTIVIDALANDGDPDFPRNDCDTTKTAAQILTTCGFGWQVGHSRFRWNKSNCGVLVLASSLPEFAKRNANLNVAGDNRVDIDCNADANGGYYLADDPTAGLYLDPNTLMFTYTPESTFNVNADSFAYIVKDLDAEIIGTDGNPRKGTSSPALVNIEYDTDPSAGGKGFGGNELGSVSWLYLSLLGLYGLLRRKQPSVSS